MKYMTAKEEDILTNETYINNGTVIDKLLQSLIVTPINYNDLVVGDKNAIMIAARVLGYGKDYQFTYGEESHTVDLTGVKDKELREEDITEKGKNEFEFTLPTTKKSITFKILTHGDESKIISELEGIRKIKKEGSAELTTRLKHLITSVDGSEEKKDIREFVDNRFLARDSRAFREHIAATQPDVNLSYILDNGEEVVVPIVLNFFWPDY